MATQATIKISSSTKSEHVPPTPTPSYTSGGLFTVLTSTTIDAPLQAVLDACLDFESWPKWNTFTTLAQPDFQPSPSDRLMVGAVFTFHSRLKRDGPTSSAYSRHEIVSIEKIDREGKPGWSIVWKTVGIPGGEWMLRTERVQELIEVNLEDGSKRTEYKTWGTFGGPMAYALSWSGTKNDIKERFGDWADGLKAFAEEWK